MRLCTNLEIKLLRAKIWALKTYYSYRAGTIVTSTIGLREDLVYAVEALKMGKSARATMASMPRIWN